MRIVQINGGAKGSTGKIMFGIAELAKAQGYDVMCASPITTTNRDAGEGCGYYRIGTFNSRRINVLLSRITGFNGCFAWIETYKFLKKFDEFKPDIIHLHNLHDSYINLPMLFNYIKKNNVSVVWTLHDCWAFTGQCPHFTIAKCNRWKTGCYDCRQYHEYPSSLYDNTKKMWQLKRQWFTGIKNLTIVTPSKWLAGLVKESYLKSYPVKVINNGINLNVFKPRKSDFREQYSIPPSGIIVLGVAFGWGYKKGLDCFIELAKELDKEKYQIVLVGTDDKVDGILPDNIISIHRTENQEKLAEIYTAADVFVNPSVEEIFGMTPVEAQACSTPSIVYEDTACADVAEQNGNKVVPQDVNALYKAITGEKFMRGEKRHSKKRGCTIVAIPRTNSPQELAEIYTAADIFANPTYEDNYPTVNLEAQACGTKVVTYDTGGCRETLIPSLLGQTAFQ